MTPTAAEVVYFAIVLGLYGLLAGVVGGSIALRLWRGPP